MENLQSGYIQAQVPACILFISLIHALRKFVRCRSGESLLPTVSDCNATVTPSIHSSIPSHSASQLILPCQGRHGRLQVENTDLRAMLARLSLYLYYYTQAKAVKKSRSARKPCVGAVQLKGNLPRTNRAPASGNEVVN